MAGLNGVMLRRRKQKAKFVETYVPSDYEFLDPDRPDIAYESDPTAEERARLATEIKGQRRGAASGPPLDPPGDHLDRRNRGHGL